MSVDVSPFELAAAAGGESLRAFGVARLVAECTSGRTAAIEIEESGPLRLRFPRVTAADALETVLLNTGGGIAGGDRLEIEIAVGEGAAVAVTSQAAEKIYRSDGSAAQIAVQLSAAPYARLSWLPQETILFDRARVTRTIDAEVSSRAQLTLCESVVFGRTAMGEVVRTGMMQDHWRIRRDGKLVFADALALHGPIARTLARPALACSALAIATLVYVASDAEGRVAAVRAVLAESAAEAGASAFDGLLVARLIAEDAAHLRSAILASLAALGTDPPRAFSL